MDTSGKKVVAALVALAGVLAAVAYWGHPVARLKPQRPKPRPTLAVLPFENLNGDAELERLAADVTLAVTAALEKLPEFDVVARQSVLEHKGLSGGVAAIAAALHADYVLAGSVERENGRLRLEAYFVKPGERPRIWADEFRYEATDVEMIPDEMARRIRQALAP